MDKKLGNTIGAWAFLIGVLLAVLVGFFGDYLISLVGNGFYVVLVVAGLLVVFFNVAARETNSFLLASVSLVIVGYMGQPVLGVVSYVGSVLTSLLVLFVPATVVVALKSVFTLARD